MCLNLDIYIFNAIYEIPIFEVQSDIGRLIALNVPFVFSC